MAFSSHKPITETLEGGIRVLDGLTSGFRRVRRTGGSLLSQGCLSGISDALVVSCPSVGQTVLFVETPTWPPPSPRPPYTHIDLRVCRGDLRHASISARCPVESDANVAVGLIT